PNASNRREEFDAAAGQTVQQAIARFEDHRQALVGLAALFATGEETTREEFDAYVEAARFGDRLPGVLTVGYAPRAATEELADLEEAVRDEGFPDFEVTSTDPESEDAFPVIYLAPMDGYENAFGFDLAGNSRGRQAIEVAASQDEPIAGPPTRVLRDGEDRAAFNLFLPVRDEEDDLAGTVFALISLEDALADLLGEDSSTRLEIYDLG